MPQYTITTTVKQDAALATEVAIENALRDSDAAAKEANGVIEPAVHITNAELLQAKIDTLLNSIVSNQEEQRKRQVAQAYNDAPDEKKASVDEALGL